MGWVGDGFGGDRFGGVVVEVSLLRGFGAEGIGLSSGSRRGCDPSSSGVRGLFSAVYDF